MESWTVDRHTINTRGRWASQCHWFLAVTMSSSHESQADHHHYPLVTILPAAIYPLLEKVKTPHPIVMIMQSPIRYPISQGCEGTVETVGYVVHTHSMHFGSLAYCCSCTVITHAGSVHPPMKAPLCSGQSCLKHSS